MLYEKLKDLSLPEGITIFTAATFILGLSYKFGFYFTGFTDAIWLIKYFSILEIMLGTINIFLIYLVALMVIERLIGNSSIFVAIVWGSILLFVFSIPAWIRAGVFPFELFLTISFSFIAMVFLVKGTNKSKVTALTCLLIFIPIMIGANESRNLRKENKIPLAIIKDSDLCFEEWRLIDKFSDKAILINFKNKNQNEYKIVDIKDINKILSQ
ncbi:MULTISPECIES: hypothetical protein [Acinetobacter calcoaceticus/baumannii complex]|uniref:hypothetical protein n=1 Tax=Acinetobacter calcoaceticus/baumannii complex TaxID=909768 RepID=UPI0004539C97|nr:hypothetical protein [Acinetobacter sp. 1294243]EXR39218.1 putative membrane protein [Acinetobacter sp. 1294243]